MAELKGTSLDILEENLEKMKQDFPEAFEEGKINFDILRQILGEYVDDAREKYQFTWNGKGKALHISQTPSLGTLRPCHEKSKNWGSTENLYIEGDNLEVLKILQRSYHRAIKMIYIDPPYNTGHDFVYKDDFKDNIENYKQVTGQVDAEGRALSANTESGGRYHTNWLNMMYPRLRLARNLLTDDGVIFISIDDNEYANLRRICDMIFGENCFVATLHVELSATQGMKVKAAQNGNIVKNAEYILVYTRDGHKNIGVNLLYDYRPEYDSHYSYFLSKDKKSFQLLRSVYHELYPNVKLKDIVSMYREVPNFKNFVDEHRDRIFRIDKTTGFSMEKFERGVIYNDYFAKGKKYTLYNDGHGIQQFLFLGASFGKCDDFAGGFGLRKIRGDWWKEFYKDMGNVSKEGNVVFENGKKPVRLIKQLIKLCTNSDDIIMDFFSGSATTAQAVMDLNKNDGKKRKFLLVQLPELCNSTSSAFKAGFNNICELGESRICNAGVRIEKEAEEKNQEVPDTGFKVFRLDSSNIKRWNPDKKDLAQSLWDYVDNFVEGRTEEDVVYEIMLKTGIDLSCPVEKLERNGHTIYSIGMGALFICLDDHVNEDVAKVLTALHQELSPETWKVVFRDNAFDRDADKTNVREMLKCEGLDPVDFLTI